MNVPNIEERLTPMKHPVPTGINFVEHSMRLPVAKGRKTNPRCISLTPINKPDSILNDKTDLPAVKKQPNQEMLGIQLKTSTKIKGLMQEAALTQHYDKLDVAINNLSK